MDVQTGILKEVATVRSGHSFRTAVQEVREGNAYIVQMRDVSLEQGINFSSLAKTMIDRPNYLQESDILFVPRGNNNIALLVGKEASQERIVATNHFMVITIKNKTVFPGFLAWWLNQKPAQHYFERQSEGTGIRNIRRTVLENTPVSLPSLEQQKVILETVKIIRQKRNIYKKLIEADKQIERYIVSSIYKN